MKSLRARNGLEARELRELDRLVLREMDSLSSRPLDSRRPTQFLPVDEMFVEEDLDYGERLEQSGMEKKSSTPVDKVRQRPSEKNIAPELIHQQRTGTKRQDVYRDPPSSDGFEDEKRATDYLDRSQEEDSIMFDADEEKFMSDAVAWLRPRHNKDSIMGRIWSMLTESEPESFFSIPPHEDQSQDDSPSPVIDQEPLTNP
jgi:hypothetical protein